ncbi:hypothetical protein TYRP_004355 [Tyrophagus putrescentiae]|nr:hypothetical protein TYRP_004355 [Tyrophagus putrescentiae]
MLLLIYIFTSRSVVHCLGQQLALATSSLLGLVVAVAQTASPYASPVSIMCPTDRILYPCKCLHNERLLCTEAMTYSVSHIFKAISHSMAAAGALSGDSGSAPFNVGPLYKEFVLSNQYITELDNNLFHSVRFEKISLVDMLSLERIKGRAFNGTTVDVHTFAIKGENRLGVNYMLEFFDSLSTLVNVREMHLELNKLKNIPSVAFRDINSGQKMRLERLYISSRSLTQIGNYAFYFLHNLRHIKIHSDVGLQHISAHAFDINQPSNHQLTIDLRLNQLTVSSFELDAFCAVGRPIRLQLSHNNLTTVPRATFERFLSVNSANEMHLADNPLDCDCAMFWILRDRASYLNQVLYALCDEAYDVWRLDEGAFDRCDANVDFMPRLILRNSAAAAVELSVRHLLLLPIFLQLIL